MLLPPSHSLLFLFFLSLTSLCIFSVAPNLFLLLLYTSYSSFTFFPFFLQITIFSFSSVPNLFLFLLLHYASSSSSTFFFPIFSFIIQKQQKQQPKTKSYSEPSARAPAYKNASATRPSRRGFPTTNGSVMYADESSWIRRSGGKKRHEFSENFVDLCLGPLRRYIFIFLFFYSFIFYLFLHRWMIWSPTIDFYFFFFKKGKTKFRKKKKIDHTPKFYYGICRCWLSYGGKEKTREKCPNWVIDIAGSKGEGI